MTRVTRMYSRTPGGLIRLLARRTAEAWWDTAWPGDRVAGVGFTYYTMLVTR